MNDPSGKQTVSGKRFFMSFSRRHGHFDFSACNPRHGSRIESGATDRQQAVAGP
ncbi:hypothetical protein [Paraburkholderia caledonica]|jgi:hypothetical protein|uniref:hypothetical protein n=1 Tax=Paraburkholderia caledonica TaxID=134536 RepID=UPI000A5E3D49|nr:hypothetical protein [Paraburkholderia caledonica]